MMIDPFSYVDQYKNASYQEILKFKNELISDITKFEHDFDRKDPNWRVCPSPDVYYQWNLEALGLIAPMLSEAFNREYESGEKNTFDYGKDMKDHFVYELLLHRTLKKALKEKHKDRRFRWIKIKAIRQ